MNQKDSTYILATTYLGNGYTATDMYVVWQCYSQMNPKTAPRYEEMNKKKGLMELDW